MKLWRAKFKLRLMDPKVRLLYLRNVQLAGEWHTKYVLENLRHAGYTGSKSTTPKTRSTANKQKFEFVNVIVEPTADNLT